jgi:p-cumate 2,3-dioxygenase beta subunit
MDQAARGLRAEVEDFLYFEAELLDAWRLDDWLGLMAQDGSYFVPPNDKPDADHHDTLFTIADDMVRLKERIIRLKDPSCHVEYPPSRTRRLIANVRAREENDEIRVRANFVIYRYRRNGDVRVFVGEYRHTLARRDGALTFKERRAVLDAEELGQLGSVSFIL